MVHCVEYPVHVSILQNRKKQEIFCMLSSFNVAVVPVSRNFFKSLFSPCSPQPLYGNSVISSFAPQPLKTYQFFLKIQSLSLKPMFTPNRRHQTAICYQARRVQYPINQRSKPVITWNQWHL